VEELLEFTRIQDGRFNLNLDLVDLLAEVEDVLFTYSSLLRQEGVSICYSCDETDIPPIQADPERIKQVLLNLLDNAVKHGKGGAVDVSVHLEGEEVVVRVRDHGPGIPEAELPHVKERFYKGSSRERGSGIGLAVCDEIVSRHGGKLLIENHSEGGVLVTVRLPVKP
jgi:signal transduction histidine kinase